MGEVAVHLEHELGALRERPPEARDVRRADPLLRLAVEHGDPRELRGEPVGDLAGAVGRAVVDDEHAVLRRVEHLAERRDHGLEVLPLVVRGEAEDRARHRRIIAGWPRRCPGTRELADQLDLLADLSEILEEESFKVIAYRRAAGRIRESPVPIAELALDGKAKELPGIGKTIERRSSRSSRTARCTR